MKSNLKILLLSVFLVQLHVFGQANGKLQIHFIDVGQGDGALLISPQGEMVLFDDGALKFCDKPLASARKKDGSPQEPAVCFHQRRPPLARLSKAMESRANLCMAGKLNLNIAVQTTFNKP